MSPRHRYYRETVWHRIPGWWYFIAWCVALGVGLAVWLSGGIGLDSGAHTPKPPGATVTTTTTATADPEPAVTVTRTADAKPAPTRTITATPTQSGKPVIKVVPGPTVTKTGAPSTVTVPGPKVTVTAPASNVVATVHPQADGKTCIKETTEGGVTRFSAPYPC